MKIRNRKALFLHSTILRNSPPRKAPDEGGDGIEVGAGFADAADRMSGDDNRTQAEKGATNADDQNDESAIAGDDGSGGDGSGGDDTGADEGGEGDDGDDEPKPKKRNTAELIRDLKRERKEARQREAALEARLAALEKGGLREPTGGDTNDATSDKPDANDATKYPLGVLDDGYITDTIEWTANQKVKAALDGRAETEKAQAEQAKAEQHVAELRTKADTMAAAGEELFDDYQETVVETAMRGEWPVTETTFTAASDATHGAEILYELAKNKAEAQRVSELSPLNQLKYVLEKDAEIATKRKGRRKPQAGEPPENIPGGRNASSPIRADTDNLDDFRKLFYSKK